MKQNGRYYIQMKKCQKYLLMQIKWMLQFYSNESKMPKKSGKRSIWKIKKKQGRRIRFNFRRL